MEGTAQTGGQQHFIAEALPFAGYRQQVRGMFAAHRFETVGVADAFRRCVKRKLVEEGNFGDIFLWAHHETETFVIRGNRGLGTADFRRRTVEQAQCGGSFDQIAAFHRQLRQLLEAFAFFAQARRPFEHQCVGRFFHLRLRGADFGCLYPLFGEMDSGAQRIGHGDLRPVAGRITQKFDHAAEMERLLLTRIAVGNQHADILPLVCMGKTGEMNQVVAAVVPVHPRTYGEKLLVQRTGLFYVQIPRLVHREITAQYAHQCRCGQHLGLDAHHFQLRDGSVAQFDKGIAFAPERRYFFFAAGKRVLHLQRHFKRPQAVAVQHACIGRRG